MFPIENDSDDPDQDGIYFRNVSESDSYYSFLEAGLGSPSCPFFPGPEVTDSDNLFWFDNFNAHPNEVLNIFLLNDPPEYTSCLKEANLALVDKPTEIIPDDILRTAWGGIAIKNTSSSYHGHTLIQNYYSFYKDLVGIGELSKLRDDVPWFPGKYHSIKCTVLDQFAILLNHEIGHILGLWHSDSTNSILMNTEGYPGIPLTKDNNNSTMSYNSNNLHKTFTSSQLSYMHCGLEDPSSYISSLLLQSDDIVHICSEAVQGPIVVLSGDITAINTEGETIESSANTDVKGDINYDANRAIKLTPGFHANPNIGCLDLNINPELYVTCRDLTISDLDSEWNLGENNCFSDRGFHVGNGFECWEDLSEFRQADEKGSASLFGQPFTCGHDHSAEHHHGHGTRKMEDIQSNNKIAIHPNPVGHTLHIQFSSNDLNAVEDAKIELLDVLGRTLNINIQQPNSEVGNIDMRNLKTGLYWVIIKDKKGKVLHREGVVKK